MRTAVVSRRVAQTAAASRAPHRRGSAGRARPTPHGSHAPDAIGLASAPRLVAERSQLQAMFGSAIEPNQVAQRQPDGDDEEDEQDVAGAVGNVATVVATAAGETGLGDAMQAVADFAEGASGAQEAVGTSDMVSRIAGGARALNTVASYVGRDLPFVGQIASAAQFAHSAMSKIPAARAEAAAARSDRDEPDLEMGRTPEERDQRVESAEAALQEAIGEAASHAGGASGVPMADKAASLAVSAVTQGPAAAAESAKKGVTSTAATLYSAVQRSSRLAYDRVAQWSQDRERAREDADYEDQLDRMERGEL